MAGSSERGKGIDPLSLLSPRDLMRVPVIVEMKNRFSTMLPSRFKGHRVYISPNTSLNSVMRADCSNKGCGVRAYIHLRRNGGLLEMVEDTPLFDRTSDTTCLECKTMLSD